MALPKKTVAAVLERDSGRENIRRRLDALSKQKGDCRIWTGSVDRQGYGRLTLAGRKPVRAHRVAWQLAFGQIPQGQIVRHKCDTPGCIRVSHLELGSVADNVRDMYERGRARSFTGVANNNAKLNDQQVREIRTRVQAGEQQSVVASSYGLTQSCVSSIARRRTWSHVD